jgi:hypothetical protein
MALIAKDHPAFQMLRERGINLDPPAAGERIDDWFAQLAEAMLVLALQIDHDYPRERSKSEGRIYNIGDPAQDWRYEHAGTCPVRQGWPLDDCDCEKKPNA